jgi:hypothetical protein
MDIWNLLKKEISYYGIRINTNHNCSFFLQDGTLKNQGVIVTIRQIKKSIESNKKVLLSLWEDVVNLLKEESGEDLFCDENTKKIFINALKDMSLFLLCFDNLERSPFSIIIENSLNREISSFTKQQINKLIDYKISIDWTHRFISRLLYINKLLSVATIGKKNIVKYNVKTARGVSGPWANLDLPMEERAYPFECEEQGGRTKDKQKQERYRKGLENYNNGGAVGEGHYWREIRNEPYSWTDKSFDSPYPSRDVLMR